MKKLINYKNINKNISLALLTFLIWASIGSKYKPFSEINDLNIKIIINYIRFFLPLLIFIILFFFRDNYQKNIYLKLTIYFIFFSFLIGIYNLYYNNVSIIQMLNNDQLLLKTGYLPNIIRDLTMSIYFLSAYLIFSRLNHDEMTRFIKLNYLFLIFISFVTLFYAYGEFFGNQKEYLYFTQFLITGELFGVPTIRSLGLSRNLFVIFIPLAIFYLFRKEKKFNFYISLILIFLSLNIFQLQSRLTIYSFYIFCMINLFLLFFKKDYKKLINIIFLFFLIPQILNLSIPITKKYFIKSKTENYNEMTKQEFKLKNIYEFTPKNIYDFFKDIKLPKSRILTLTPNNPDYSKKYKDNQFVLVSEYSSGRLELWKKTLNLFINKNNYKNIFLGFGSSADRLFLKETVSNALLYSLISGGYLGLIFLILFYLYILSKIYNFLIHYKEYSKDIISISSITIIIFIMLRSLVESSFLVFGSDSIILFICLFYINNNKLS